MQFTRYYTHRIQKPSGINQGTVVRSKRSTRPNTRSWMLKCIVSHVCDSGEMKRPIRLVRYCRQSKLNFIVGFTKIFPSPPGPADSSVSSTTIVWNDPLLISSTNGDKNVYVEAEQSGNYRVPSSLTTSPSITEVQVYNFTVIDTAAGSNFIEASRLITVKKTSHICLLN